MGQIYNLVSLARPHKVFQVFFEMENIINNCEIPMEGIQEAHKEQIPDISTGKTSKSSKKKKASMKKLDEQLSKLMGRYKRRAFAQKRVRNGLTVSRHVINSLVSLKASKKGRKGVVFNQIK